MIEYSWGLHEYCERRKLLPGNCVLGFVLSRSKIIILSCIMPNQIQIYLLANLVHGAHHLTFSPSKI